MARRRFFAAWVEGRRAGVDGAAAGHLARVLRAAPGQEFELAHGGRVYLGRVASTGPRRVEFDIVREEPRPEPEARIELAAAVFKFDRFEWMLEKATELGLHRLQPLRTRRTDPRLAAAAGQRRARWQRIAHEAAEQSRRAEAPEILPLQAFREYLAGPRLGTCVILAEDSSVPEFRPARREPLTLLTGPEGGWTPEELAAAGAAGAMARSLGPRILRCETAILAALARI